MRWAIVLVCASFAFACTEPNVGRLCCEDDGDCAAGGVCFEGTCTAACVDDGGCAVGEVCVTAAGACAQALRTESVCPFGAPDLEGCEIPDPFEPNNGREDAVQVPEFAELALCPAGDEDFFALDLGPGDEVEIEIAFDADEGDLDLQLIAADGQVLVESRGLGDRERIVAVAGEGGRVFIRVFGFNNDENAYEIATSVEPGGECAPDEFEPNDERPHEIPAVAEFGATLCAGDVDLYVFETPGNVPGRLFIEHDHPSGIVAEIRREGGQGALAETGPGFASMEFNIGAPGELILEVRGRDDVEFEYNVVLEIEGALPFECEDDEFEPNDNDDSATPLVLPEFLEATLCEDDVDRFGFFAEADENIRLRIEHSDPQGLFVRVRRLGGGSADANTGPGFAELDFRSLVSGQMVIEVEPLSGREVAYNLSVELRDGPGPGPGGCGDDDHEPNDDPTEATLVEDSPQVVGGVVCGPDPDFFRVTSFADEGGFLRFSTPGVRFTVVDQQSGFTADVQLDQGESELVAVPQLDEFFIIVTRQGPPRAYEFLVGFLE